MVVEVTTVKAMPIFHHECVVGLIKGKPSIYYYPGPAYVLFAPSLASL
jgi:hypothetical protein